MLPNIWKVWILNQLLKISKWYLENIHSKIVKSWQDGIVTYSLLNYSNLDNGLYADTITIATRHK